MPRHNDVNPAQQLVMDHRHIDTRLDKEDTPDCTNETVHPDVEDQKHPKKDHP